MSEVYGFLDTVLAARGRPQRVMHGGCRGADLLAKSWAESKGIFAPRLNALWDVHGQKLAGPNRNEELLCDAVDLAKIRNQTLLVLAMPGPVSCGTHDMIARVKAAARVFGGPTMELFIQEVSQ